MLTETFAKNSNSMEYGRQERELVRSTLQLTNSKACDLLGVKAVPRIRVSCCSLESHKLPTVDLKPTLLCALEQVAYPLVFSPLCNGDDSTSFEELFLFIFLIWLPRVSVAVCGIISLHCDTWDL